MVAPPTIDAPSAFTFLPTPIGVNSVNTANREVTPQQHKILWLGVTAAVGIAVMVDACSTNYPRVPPPISTMPPPRVETRTTSNVVKASWYGPGFAGHKTSTGERFDPNQLTAASKTLPLGSVVAVTNPENGRSVKVRINDCGPYVRGRSLDLSHRAAQKIGITHAGVARVEVTKIATPIGAYRCLGATPRRGVHSHRRRMRMAKKPSELEESGRERIEPSDVIAPSKLPAGSPSRSNI
jgi:rare lipoprotein A (peptidoglycan hydrolase)